MNQVPLPKSITAKIKFNTHPGLALDKYAPSYASGSDAQGFSEETQKPTIENVIKLSQKEPSILNFPAIVERYKKVLEKIGAKSFTCKTTSPLALHLARASALENAGICLHPIYGFAYIPASGLKGMARAYAETVWLQQEGNSNENKEKILAVFGNDPGEKVYEKQKAGAIVFHDAFPTSWPRLMIDIVNCHHPEYYSGESEDGPGDWENPIPNYFLAVEAGTKFQFALSKRQADADESLKLAKEWLLGALCQLGAGAKTNAGYGAFTPTEEEQPKFIETETRKKFEAELELVTPAFLAGASQREADCDLRPATLRGLLRWWWRTMHAGWVDTKTLRAMEATIWGDTNSCGAVKIELETIKTNVIKAPFKEMGENKKHKKILIPNKSFAEKNEIEVRNTSMPLHYFAYGMDEMPAGEERKRKTRYCALPSSKWKIKLFATKRDNLSANLILEQAQNSLWLLCNFGGVGSKSRKGYGSLSLVSEDIELTIEKCKESAKKFRIAYGAEDSSFRLPMSSSLEEITKIEIPTKWRNYWYALNEVSQAAHEFAQSPTKTGHGKHCEDKIVLGIPRQIHGPLNKPLKNQNGWQPPLKLKGPKCERYASPVHIHFSKNQENELTISITAFHDEYLHNIKRRKQILEEYVRHLTTEIEKKKENSSGRKLAWNPPTSQPPETQKLNNKRVTAILLEEKTKKGGWKAKEERTGIVGAILPSPAPPENVELKAGNRVELYVHSNDPSNTIFRWPSLPDTGSKSNKKGKKRK